jgi:cytochrome P450
MSDAMELLNDPDVVECPFGLYRMLLENEPVVGIPGVGVLVTRYDHVQEVTRHPELYSSAYSTGFASTGLTINPRPPAVDEVLAQGYPEVQALIFTDDPVHRRHRGLVSQGFTPRRVAQLSDTVRAIAGDLIDRFAGRGNVELLTAYATPLPLTVISDALGVPRRDAPVFKRWSDAVMELVGRVVPEDEYVAVAHRLLDFQRYFAALIDERRNEPRDDLLTDLVRAEMEGEHPLSKSELLNIITQLLVAGNETTANALCAGMLLLLEQPRLTARIATDRQLIPNLIEEVLRLESPIQGFPRMATEDTELGGVKIPKGSRVILMYGAGNRDEQEFPCPDEVDLDRPNLRSHLAFSHGPHHCMGAALARAELQISFELLLERLPNLRLGDGFIAEHKPSLMVRGLKELHLAFDRC